MDSRPNSRPSGEAVTRTNWACSSPALGFLVDQAVIRDHAFFPAVVICKYRIKVALVPQISLEHGSRVSIRRIEQTGAASCQVEDALSDRVARGIDPGDPPNVIGSAPQIRGNFLRLLGGPGFPFHGLVENRLHLSD